MRLLFLLLLLYQLPTSAQRIYGTVFNDRGDLLPFSSLTIKGSSIGASANDKGKFSILLSPGNYTITCQHIGYAAVQKTVELREDVEITFILAQQKLVMKEVVVRTADEDPAYEIMRNAIRKRPYYKTEVEGFTCDLYGKDIIKLRNLPGKILGKKIKAEDRKEMGVDSTGKGIVYLSESISKIYSLLPDKFKMEVTSSRVSGSGSFGFTFPAFISLYNNNVSVFTDRLNPRGFVSPIADGAISFYKYKFLGTFWEDGKAVNSIKVIPRRKYEPLFSGIINITDEDWRIHSFNLVLTKSAQLEIIDTLQITQFHSPIGNIWRVKNQLLHFNFKMFGIDAIGNFLSIYSNYTINPVYKKNFFDRVIIKYDTGVSNKSIAYWDSIRPVPLEEEEIKDYNVKDSIYKLNRDSMFSRNTIDSLKKKQGKIKPLDIFWSGINRIHYSHKNQYSWSVDPLIKAAEYNTAEGLVLNLNTSVRKYLAKWKTNLSFEPHLRYGFSNTHLNAWASLGFRTRDTDEEKRLRRYAWNFSGGKRVSEFNKESTLSPMVNSIGILFFGDNIMKTYENYFGNINYSRRYESGLRFSINALFEDRIPLDNTTTFTLFKKDSSRITPNYPIEKITSQFTPHQAAIISATVSFKPGQRYIQLPNNTIPFGSKYPTFAISYTKGIRGIFGSDEDFDKWRFSIYDDKNLKLAGTFRYRIGIGGFLNDNKVYIQDFQHFNGNRTVAASEYLNSFQLAKYYANSTTASFYSFGHAEHHFNGLITNKIPLFRQLNWYLVAGGNAFYVNNKNNYVELFVGLENIFKILRVDFIAAYENGKRGHTGIRLGSGGSIGGGV
ncbi:MAG TPA: DUF5686 and carboxypeptidase regulatory-like domain-containing protein, partial [Ferruginibacter sp.]|nr:DUF5686 and carboxypeptidase regulatory-like domain-containing protein [Ferruginibacter sp.]